MSLQNCPLGQWLDRLYNWTKQHCSHYGCYLSKRSTYGLELKLQHWAKRQSFWWLHYTLLGHPGRGSHITSLNTEHWQCKPPHRWDTHQGSVVTSLIISSSQFVPPTRLELERDKLCVLLSFGIVDQGWPYSTLHISQTGTHIECCHAESSLGFIQMGCDWIINFQGAYIPKRRPYWATATAVLPLTIFDNSDPPVNPWRHWNTLTKTLVLPQNLLRRTSKLATKNVVFSSQALDIYSFEETRASSYPKSLELIPASPGELQLFADTKESRETNDT